MAFKHQHCLTIQASYQDLPRVTTFHKYVLTDKKYPTKDEMESFHKTPRSHITYAVLSMIYLGKVKCEEQVPSNNRS